MQSTHTHAVRLPLTKRRFVTVKQATLAGVPYTPAPPSRDGGLCEVEHNDVWLTSLDGPWVVAYRLAAQDRRLVIAELRLYPRPKGQKEVFPWSDRQLDGLGDRNVPRGGLTSSTVHRIRPAFDVETMGREILAALQRHPALWARLREAGVASPDRAPRHDTHRAGGPTGKGLSLYRKIAEVYSAAPEKPVAAVRRAFPAMSSSAVTAAIHRARNRYELLPPTTRGRAAGWQPISRPLGVAKTAALQRIATKVGRGGRKSPQVRIDRHKKARKS